MTMATLTSKGQVTIPKSVREILDLQKGDKLYFIVTKNGEVLIRPASKRVDDVFGRLHKTGRGAVSVTEMDAGIRERLKRSSK